MHSLWSFLLLPCALVIAKKQPDPWPQWTYKTEPFTSPKFGDIVNNGKTEEGYLFIGIESGLNTSASATIYENTGDVVWHGNHDAWLTYNFRQQVYQGKPVLTYWTSPVGGHDSFGHGYGEIIIRDDKYNLVDSICLTSKDINIVKPLNEKKMSSPCLLDDHESYITDQDTMIATAFNVTQTDLTKVGGSKDGWVFDGVIFEIDIKTKKVLWQWSLLDHIDITKSNYRNFTEGANPLDLGGEIRGVDQSNPWDIYHMNSVQPIPGGYIMNSRMTWSFYKIDAKTGDIDWTIEGSHGGDMTLEKGIFFSWCHHVRVDFPFNPDKFTIHFFNNDNGPVTVGTHQNVSSGYLLEVDAKAKTVKEIHNLKNPHKKLFTSAQGGYHALSNNHVLMGYGVHPVVQEFDGSGNVVFGANFGPTHHSGWAISYRAYRYQWSAHPEYPPKVAFENGHAYMSWNGATADVFDGWNVYYGKSMDSLKNKTVTKNGFESSVDLGTNGQPAHLIAEATLKGKGVSNSTHITVVGAKKNSATSLKASWSLMAAILVGSVF